MSLRLWPAGLIGRVGLVLFAAIVLELVASTFIFEQAELISSGDAQVRRVAQQIETAVRVLAATSPASRPALAISLSDPDLDLHWQVDAVHLALPSLDGRMRELRDKLLRFEPTLAERHLALVSQTGDTPTTAHGNLMLGDGSAILFHVRGLGGALPDLAGRLRSILVLSSAVLLAALLVVRTLATPLRMLGRATDAIGRGPAIPIDDRHGPREIRGLARAFNAMQDRIAKLIADRTEALAAVSHDLRTPIARMKLRTDLAKGLEDKSAFEADLAEMDAMLDDLQAYLGGESNPERPKRTDVAAILQTLVDDATDAGHRASYDGPDHLVLELRARAMKRAFSNIINNAIAYGDVARVTLHTAGPMIVVAVRDEGPGIAETEQEAVFTPFYRSDASRNRATGGMGLGLAISRHAVQHEGGTIRFSTPKDGGLQVVISVPSSPSARA